MSYHFDHRLVESGTHVLVIRGVDGFDRLFLNTTELEELRDVVTAALPAESLTANDIREALLSYRCIEQVDEDGCGVSLLDALSPDGNTIGREELENLAFHLWDELPGAGGPPRGPGKTSLALLEDLNTRLRKVEENQDYLAEASERRDDEIRGLGGRISWVRGYCDDKIADVAKRLDTRADYDGDRLDHMLEANVRRDNAICELSDRIHRLRPSPLGPPRPWPPPDDVENAYGWDPCDCEWDPVPREAYGDARWGPSDLYTHWIHALPAPEDWPHD